MKLIAVEGFSYDVDNPNVYATITLTGTPSNKSFCDNKGICKDGFSILVSNIYTAEAPLPDPVTYPEVFSATAEKGEADGDKVLRLDDTTGVITAFPLTAGGTPVAVSFKVKITDAGQNKVFCS